MRSHWMPAANSPHAAPAPVRLQALSARVSPAPARATNPLAPSEPGLQRRNEAQGASPQPSPRGGCHATYHGQGTLSVISSVTGHHYRFEGKGCTLSIDPRDRLVLGRLQELSIHSSAG